MHHLKVLAKKFHFSGHNIGYCPQTQELEPPDKTRSFNFVNARVKQPRNAIFISGLQLSGQAFIAMISFTNLKVETHLIGYDKQFYNETKVKYHFKHGRSLVIRLGIIWVQLNRLKQSNFA